MGKATGTRTALGYCRVSTDGQKIMGASLEAQEAMIREECDRRGWAVEIVREIESGKNTTKRPVLRDVLDRLAVLGKCGALVCTRQDRVSRSVIDSAKIVEAAREQRWALVFTTESFDLDTPGGRFTANVWASAAQYERELISVRTTEGMAAKRAQGVHLGRTSALDPDLITTVVDLASRMSRPKVAAQLNAEGKLTLSGRPWTEPAVRSVLQVAGVVRRKADKVS